MITAVAETNFREIDLSQPIGFGEEVVSRLKNKLKPLHRFEKLIHFLIEYFLKYNEAFKTIRNLQMLDHKDIRHLDEWNVSASAHKMFEECLIKNYSMSGFISGNVEELYEMTCELVKRKER